MKQKAFFIIFKGLSLKQIKQIFWDSGSSALNVLLDEVDRGLRQAKNILLDTISITFP